MKAKKMLTILFLAGCVMLVAGQFATAGPVGTAFTYQGRLIDANEAADGLYDFQFKLYDSEADGNQIGGDVNSPDVDVIDGYFTVELDFGNVFDGNACWLDIGVRPGELEDPNVYTLLIPRQAITPAPYALYVAGGGGGESLWQVNETSIYYNNGNVGIGTLGPAAKLEVNGDIRAASNYKIGGNTVLSVAGTENTLVGIGAGHNNTTGYSNIFSGYKAGYSNTTGNNNTFSGYQTGLSNTTGYSNTFLGQLAGYSNTTGSGNVFLGNAAGYNESGSNKLYIANSSGTPLIYGDFSTGNVGVGTTSPASKLSANGDISAASVYKIGSSTVLSVAGTENTLVGAGAGAVNTGSYNTFSGSQAGCSNTTGSSNTFTGRQAGYSSTTGNGNTFSGYMVGCLNTTGSYNTFSGCQAGSFNTTGGGNTFSGYNAGFRNSTGNSNTFIGTDAGFSATTGSSNTFTGNGAGYENTTGYSNIFTGNGAGHENTTGYYNTFLGDWAGGYNTTGNNNTFVGNSAGISNTSGSNNTFIGNSAGNNNNGTGNVFIGSEAGFNATGSNKLYIANSDVDPPLIYGDFSTGRVGIKNTSPAYQLDVTGSIRATGTIFGSVDNADKVDGYHAGNASGQIPISNGTLCTNLNTDLLDGLTSGNSSGQVPVSNGTTCANLSADLLDGLNSGNSSGQVPISNGTVCTNLNADLLDGQHASSFIGTGSDYGRSGVASNLYEGTTTLTDKYVNQSGDSMTGSTSGSVLSVSNSYAGDGRAIYGNASNSGSYLNIGGYFLAAGYYGKGVYGRASYTGEYTNYGGYFESNGGTGRGVFGKATGDTEGIGAYGDAPGTYGKGVYGGAGGTYGIGVAGYGNWYDFYAYGPGTDYGPFTGGHEVKLTDDFPANIRPGMIVSVTGKAEVRQDDDGKITISSTLPTVKLCNVANDKAVFGVFAAEGPLPKDHWYKAKDSERFATVNALGEGRVWVCNINGEVEVGDYITTSAVAGYGQKQDDDLLRSCTLGKATETVDWNSVRETVEFGGRTYKVYLIAVVYTSG